jgi:hypothetical protein
MDQNCNMEILALHHTLLIHSLARFLHVQYRGPWITSYVISSLFHDIVTNHRIQPILSRAQHA